MQQGSSKQQVNDEIEITAKFRRSELLSSPRREPRTQPEVVPFVRFGAKTDLGNVRENNEDKFDFFEPTEPVLLAERGCVYAVCDGMGGHSAGQIASELALKTFLKAYYDLELPDIDTALTVAVQAANALVREVAQAIPGRRGMGTTLTAAALCERDAHIVHVGDSRCYLVRGEAVEQVTDDHSYVMEQVRQGLMTLEEAQYSPYRNVITRSIGMDAVEPDLYRVPLQAGDCLVLCTDGLTTHVSDEQIAEVVRAYSPSAAAQRLVEMALEGGGSDNVTVIVLQVLALLPWEQARQIGWV
ncbi:MAG: Stp1/IreP family PP2C-type Ser/Thr phosphatase [Armatimonadota bacterium]|nr:Stp1/IreP family PP2C-type Ser/Thr phosphatase [Armatimonadota bacterium]MDW8105042.1 Stp1/IreP family PP2C-type Ser/Thr phosphatase [Armatimonadota bacterium]MDW8289146.1 Stp1/IreP family PP2C-type Ser/Thr phosphatase [Armatimonadota bacterium]